MNEATRVLLRQLIRLAKGMITALDDWLRAQECDNAKTKEAGQ